MSFIGISTLEGLLVGQRQLTMSMSNAGVPSFRGHVAKRYIVRLSGGREAAQGKAAG